MKNNEIDLKAVLLSSGSLKIKLIKLADLLLGTLICLLIKGRKFYAPENLPCERLLVIRPGGIGDAVFLLPLLRELKRQRPNMRIDILCEKRNHQIFRSQKEVINRIFCYDACGSFLSLFQNTYDVVIDTEQWHYFSALISYFLKPKCAIGFATRPLRAKLFHQKITLESDAYELLNFQRLFTPVCPDIQKVQDIDTSFLVSNESQEWARDKIPEKSISLFLGASIPERRLTKEQSLDIIRFILQKKYDVIILGGRDVRKECEDIEREVSDDRLMNFAGKVSLEQSAALIKQSKVFVGPDSGLMHLACAVGTPVVAIFGPGNLKKWGPRGDPHTVLTENVSCSPCTCFGYTVTTCKKSYPCMRNLNIENLKKTIKKKTIL
ncbi:MAG: glycosyltransferase family 9 protein [Candidatus Omnitrophota bacterium]